MQCASSMITQVFEGTQMSPANSSVCERLTDRWTDKIEEIPIHEPTIESDTQKWKICTKWTILRSSLLKTF